MPPEGPKDPATYEEQVRQLESLKEQLAQAKLQNQEKKVESLEKEVSLLEETVRLSALSGKDIEAQVKNYQDLLRGTKELKNTLKDINDLGSAATKAQLHEKEFLKERIRQNVATLKQQDNLNIKHKRYVEGLNKGKKILGTILSLTKGIANAQKEFTNLDATMFNKSTMEGMANSLSDLSARMNKVSGVGKDMTKVLTVQGSKMKNLGQLTKDVAESYQALYPAMVGFGRLSNDIQRDLMDHSFMMTKLNISYQDTAKFMNIAMKAMKMGTPTAKEFQKTIAKMGKAIAMGPKAAATAWMQATPEVLYYGNQQKEMFKGLLAVSEATGISITGITGAMSQFDKFEPAAQIVSQMNALLGTQLNSVDLLNMSLQDRAKYIKQNMLASGHSFAAMNKQEKQAVMAAMRMTDLDQATRFFNTSLEEIGEMEDKLSPANVGIQNLNKSMDKSVGLAERRKAAQEAIIVEGAKQVKPALETQAKFMATSTELFNKLAESARTVGNAYKYMTEKGTEFMQSGAGQSMIGTLGQVNAASSTWTKTGGQVMGPLGSAGGTAMNILMYRRLAGQIKNVGSATKIATQAAGTGGAVSAMAARRAASLTPLRGAGAGASMLARGAIPAIAQGGAIGSTTATLAAGEASAAGIGMGAGGGLLGAGLAGLAGLAGVGAMAGLLSWIGSASDPKKVAESRRDLMQGVIKGQELDNYGTPSPHRLRYLAQTLALSEGETGDKWHRYSKRADDLLSSQFRRSNTDATKRNFGPIIWPEAFDPAKLKATMPEFHDGGKWSEAMAQGGIKLSANEFVYAGGQAGQAFTPAQQQSQFSENSSQAPVNIKIELGGTELANLQNVLANTMNTHLKTGMG